MAFSVADKLHVDAAVLKRGNTHCFDLDGIDAGLLSSKIQETRLARSLTYLADRECMYWVSGDVRCFVRVRSVLQVL